MSWLVESIFGNKKEENVVETIMEPQEKEPLSPNLLRIKIFEGAIQEFGEEIVRQFGRINNLNHKKELFEKKKRAELSPRLEFLNAALSVMQKYEIDTSQENDEVAAVSMQYREFYGQEKLSSDSIKRRCAVLDKELKKGEEIEKKIKSAERAIGIFQERQEMLEKLIPEEMKSFEPKIEINSACQINHLMLLSMESLEKLFNSFDKDTKLIARAIAWGNILSKEYTLLTGANYENIAKIQRVSARLEDNGSRISFLQTLKDYIKNELLDIQKAIWEEITDKKLKTERQLNEAGSPEVLRGYLLANLEFYASKLQQLEENDITKKQQEALKKIVASGVNYLNRVMPLKFPGINLIQECLSEQNFQKLESFLLRSYSDQLLLKFDVINSIEGLIEYIEKRGLNISYQILKDFKSLKNVAMVLGDKFGFKIYTSSLGKAPVVLQKYKKLDRAIIDIIKAYNNIMALDYEKKDIEEAVEDLEEAIIFYYELALEPNDEFNSMQAIQEHIKSNPAIECEKSLVEKFVAFKEKMKAPKEMESEKSEQPQLSTIIMPIFSDIVCAKSCEGGLLVWLQCHLEELAIQTISQLLINEEKIEKKDEFNLIGKIQEATKTTKSLQSLHDNLFAKE